VKTKNEQNKKDTSFRTTIGGQALIEGILMRGPKKQAIVVNAPDGPVEKVEELRLIKERYPILGWPLIRGAVVFMDSMVKGVKALSFSAEYFPEDDEEPSKFDQWLERKFGNEALTKFFIGFAVVLGLAFSIGLFIILPTLLAGLIIPAGSATSSGGSVMILSRGSMIGANLIEGGIRIVLFLVYLIVISKTKDIKRVFSYHGAEHKTIFCYERNLELTVKNVREMPRHHPRCGTSFLFVVMVISILVFSVIQWSSGLVRVLIRLALLPLVVGISYEINRWVGRHDNTLSRILTAPGLWLQNFTTNEPDDKMIEAGIRALKLVLPEEKGEDAW
jgi:uncharacterized protein YqhQ